MDKLNKLNRAVVKHSPPTTWLGVGSRSAWTLVKPLEMLNGTVPVGFKTDGVTIPFWIFLLAKPAGTMFEPAIWHDYVLSLLKDNESRKTADEQFKQEGNRYGVNKFRVLTLFYAVRAFGILKVLINSIKRNK